MNKKSKGGDYPFIFSTCETVSGVQCKILDLSVSQSYWNKFRQRVSRWSGAGELLLWKETEGDGMGQTVGSNLLDDGDEVIKTMELVTVLCAGRTRHSRHKLKWEKLYLQVDSQAVKQTVQI